MDYVPESRISIQVSLSGYSFKIKSISNSFYSGWQSAEHLFTTSEFQNRYDKVEIALFTPKFTLVPKQFFNPLSARQVLADMVELDDKDSVDYYDIDEQGAVLIYSNTIGESLSKAISQTVLTTAGDIAKILPEVYYMLMDLKKCNDYNKIVCSYRDGYVYLVIAQGKSLLLVNSFRAEDFNTAEYYIFLSMNNLQLNPEISTITFRTPLKDDEELSLYRYFKAVEVIL